MFYKLHLTLHSIFFVAIRCDEKSRIKSYTFVTFLLEKMHISKLNLNRNLFLKLFDLCKVQLITNINPVKGM